MPVHDWTQVPADIFHDFHLAWIVSLEIALNSGVLPPGFYALAEQVAGGLEPDVLTLGTSRPEPSGTGGEGGLALATSPPRVRFTAAAETQAYARRRSRVAIRHARGDDVVAVVEIVSPGNKTSRRDLRAFLDKAMELLDQEIHLLVIDLFPPGPLNRQGIHGSLWSEMVGEEFQLPAGQDRTLASYAAGLVKRAFVEVVAVGDVLPDMPLFLEPGRYVPAPLEASYQAAFAAVPPRWQRVVRGESGTA